MIGTPNPEIQSRGTALSKIFLSLKVMWQHVVFNMFPTPEEDYYTAIGDIYFKLGQYRKAIKSLEKSEKARHSSERAYGKFNSYYLGYSYLHFGNHVRALYYFDKYLSYTEDIDILAIAGACSIVLERWEKAVKYYSKYLNSVPEDVYIRINYAMSYWNLKDKSEAIKQLDIAEKHTHSESSKKILQSTKYYFNAEIDNAIAKLKDIISSADFIKSDGFYQTQLDIYSFLARLQRENGDRPGARQTLENAYLSFPDEWTANDLALEYAEQDIKLPEALKLINDALKSQPDNSLFLDTKGWILFKMHDIDKARELIEHSLQLNSYSKEAKLHYEEILRITTALR